MLIRASMRGIIDLILEGAKSGIVALDKLTVDVTGEGAKTLLGL
jgi:hypothetical protein